MLLVCALLGWPALHPAIPTNMQAVSTTFILKLVERVCTVLFRHMNYKVHFPMAAATKFSATARKVSGLVGRYRYLTGMPLGDGGINVQTLYQQTVRDVVRSERQCNGLTLLYRDFRGIKREALGMDLNRPLLAARGENSRCDKKQGRDERGKS
jgi:hypothetical protein